MLIISKFHDYYDVGMRMGIDKTIVYNRERIEIPLDTNPFIAFHKKHATPTVIDRLFMEPHVIHGLIQNIILFCGNIVFCYEISNKYEVHNYLDCPTCKNKPASKKFCAYTLKEVLGLLKSHVIKLNKNQYNQMTTTQAYIANSTYTLQRDTILNLHREFKSPIIILPTPPIGMNYHIIVNPCLKEYEFYKRLNPIIAFQEIQMFISGVLGAGEKDTVEISEKDKLKSHGFDPKWSFRKEPK